MRIRDKIRRRIARTVLAVFGWVPLVALIFIAFFIRSKTYVEWSESALTNALEMQINFKSFERPRWDTSRFEYVTLSDPETGEPVLKCALLEVEHQHTKTPIPLLRIRLKDCKIYMDNSVSLWSFVHRSFAHRRLWKNMQVEFSAVNASFNSCNTQKIRFMSGTLKDVESGVEGVFAIYLEDKTEAGETGESNEPVRLKIARLTNASPVTTTIALDASKRPIASGMLSRWYAPLKRLSGNSSFHGTIVAANAGAGWDGTVTGEFDNVDLSQMFIKAGRAQLVANAKITIDNGEFIDQRLVSARGRVDAQNGVIDRSLLDTLVTQLRLSGSGMFNPYSDATQFRQLAFGFDIQNEMISFTGKCSSCPPGTILNSQWSLVREPLNPSDKSPLAVAMKTFSYADSQKYIQIAQPDANSTR